MPEHGAVKGWKNVVRIGVSSAQNESIWKAGRDPLLNSLSVETSTDIEKIWVIGSRQPVSIVEGVTDITGSLERNLYSKNATYNEFIYVNDTTHYDLLKVTGLQGEGTLGCKILYNPLSNNISDGYTRILTDVRFHNYRITHSARDIVAESVDFDGSQLAIAGKWKITIVGTNTTLHNYQIKVEFPLSKFSINPEMFSSDSICFTDKNGSVISHWNESWTGKQATFWCKVPIIPANTSTHIWMHCADPFIHAESNASNTFERVISGLVSCWHFDENTSNIAYDTGGSDNDGTITGGTWTTGKFGHAIRFAIDSTVNFGGDASLYPGTGSFTVEGWIKHLGYEYPRTVFPIGRFCADLYPGWELGHAYDPDGIQFILRDTSGNTVSDTLIWDSGYKPADIENSWAHIVVIFNRDSGKAISYVNGVKQSGEIDISSVTGKVTSAEDIKIGMSCGWKLDGIVDDVRIYNKALNSSEISDLYNHYGYTTLNYPSKVLVRKYTSPEPTVII